MIAASIATTMICRMRLKANGPSACAPSCDNSPVIDQQIAAPSAASSYPIFISPQPGTPAPVNSPITSGGSPTAAPLASLSDAAKPRRPVSR